MPGRTNDTGQPPLRVGTAGYGDTTGGSAMTPHQAWRAGARDAADKLGFLQDLGTVEPGKLADLVVLDADPLHDVHNSTRPRWVIKNGEVFEASTLKASWPQEKVLPKMFWEDKWAAGHNHEGAKARRHEEQPR